MTTHRIKLPYPSPPLHANQRLVRQARDRVIAEVRRDAGWLVKAAKVGRHERVTVGLEWRPKVNRRRDGAENLAPLLKPLIDGMVDVGVTSDDTPELVERRMPVLLPAGKGEPGMWFVVETP
ncbi:hypothetical protein [Actinomycetospora termitidis]|uniref:Uncharacterized protein n=1 Tax=Actinomycetospora termitidis TaxID=3053470 RepID=A0ABT7MFL2_9PSEU|nr:hypothetical protein [Actinomycetospora sp. Odt1-22]MDL5159457.1 hypothetical protein [Actinomycetospora sp. Odt1-22]